MKKLSKLAAIIIAVVMMLGIAAPAYAYEGVTEKDGVMQLGDFDNLIDGHIIYYPTDLENSNEKYPVAVWANGTMCAPALYYDLLVGVAKQGYIVIASPELMAKDGTDQIASIDYIFAENEDADSPFYGKVDTDKIGVFGHSQGGLSSVNAAVADERIGAVVSIAGASNDSQTENLNTPTLFLTGNMDTVVLSALWVKPSYEACPAPAVYASLKGGIHTSCILNADTYINYTVKWFNAWLYNNGDKSPFRQGGELSKDSAWTGYRSKNLDNNLFASVFANEIGIYAAIALAVIAVGGCTAAVIVKKRKDASEKETVKQE